MANKVKFNIHHVNGGYRDFEITTKEWKNELVPDEGMPFSLGIVITDSQGREVTISFDQKGECTIHDRE